MLYNEDSPKLRYLAQSFTALTQSLAQRKDVILCSPVGFSPHTAANTRAHVRVLRRALIEFLLGVQAEIGIATGGSGLAGEPQHEDDSDEEY